MSGRVEEQPAYVLHLRAYRDSSAIVELFSRDYGRVSAVAKGLKGSAKRRQSWRSALQPGNLLTVSWLGRSELKTLADVQLSSTFPLRGDALYCSFYINELVGRLLQPFDAHPHLFKLYGRSLMELCSAQSLEPCLRRFELALLAELGYGIDFDALAAAPATYYVYHLDEGFCPVPESQAGQAGVFPGECLIALSRQDWETAGVLAVAKRLNRQVLAPLLGDRPLQSRKLFVRSAHTHAGDSFK